MKRRAWLILGPLAALVLLIALTAAKLTSAVPVEVARARSDRIREFVDERGKTRLPETYLITMPFAGRLDVIVVEDEKRLSDWKEGDPVKEGDVVARIVPRDLERAVRQANATVERLTASIAENADVRVEETAYDQANFFVESIKETVKAALARVDAGEAKFVYAKKDLDRIKQLVATNAATPDDLDRANVRYVQSDVDFRQDKLVYAAMVAMQEATKLMPTMVRQFIDRKELTEHVLVKEKAEAEIRLEQVRQDQQRGTMRSPIDGVILQRFASNERFLSAGTQLLEIGRLQDLEVEADVLSVDVVSAKVGDPVEIYGPAIGRPPARGTVARIHPAGFTKISSLGVEQQRVKVIIRFHSEDLDRLLARRHLGVGYRVRVRIFTASKPKALVIPRSAIFRARDGSWQVFAVRNGRARLQKITVGLLNDESVEVLNGLAEGEQVVLAPESNLTNGARVEPEPQGS